METYIKYYDWMNQIDPIERHVYALVYQLTQSTENGCYYKLPGMAAKLGIERRIVKKALNHLIEIKAIIVVEILLHQPGRRNLKVYRTDKDFAHVLKTLYEQHNPHTRSSARNTRAGR